MIKKNFTYFLATLLFILFFIISVWTPLAGDDWGYALTGMNNNPFAAAISFYYGWSGRFFSELYGFLVAPNKWFWNILNPSLFVIIYISIIKIVKPKNVFSASLITLMWMLSIKDELRMETYSWIMGTTYVIPLALSLVFFTQVKSSILENHKLSLLKQILLSIALFYIGLTMENISVVMVFMVLTVLIYKYFVYQKIDFTWLRFSVISFISLLLLRLSPGANFRLERDHQDWISLSIFEQIQSNYSQFIQHTFIDNKIFVLSFTLLLIAVVLFSKSNKIIKSIIISLLSIALIISVSLSLTRFIDLELFIQMSSPESLINAIYWLIYIICVFFVLITELKGNDLKIAIFFLLAAGLANGSMLLSPIFGYRSSLFTLYFMMIVGLLLLNQIKFNSLHLILSILLTVLILNDSYDLIHRYKLVKDTHFIRLEEIQYYKDNPDIKEAWLIRYPIFTIHGGDIEEDDTYHMETFKTYYGLEDDVHLIFYYPD